MAGCSPNPGLIVIPDGNTCKGGSFMEPIVIDDDVVFLGVAEKCTGSSRSSPIIVEQERSYLPRLRSIRGQQLLRSRTAKRPLLGAALVGKPIIEIGESSGFTFEEKMLDLGDSSRTQPGSTCEICTESKYHHELFAIDGCSHAYCKNCVNNYVSGKVEENFLYIKCPDPDCKNGKLDPLICSRILEKRVFDHWCKALCESIVNEKFYCPFKDCSALMIDDRGKGITEAECPHCFRLFCAQCRTPWHAGFTCRDFQMLGKDERKKEDLMLMDLAKRSHWQRCPRCKFFVERIDGCTYMKCRCGFCFCYRCGAPMQTDHYCSICKS
ncbi:hypothetical protein HPP92_018698 [Vanilla planifolia]|uniref:RBR-type E3 ubiquitin transferase n=1 Tax=Vanilla planifolia TaxID=51239 RepID=A0A835QA93_VANPL|nr:hypothetical protein HPP92_018698 [Vanilla planifolia]